MLTTIAIKNAKPKKKQYRLTDNQGLYLLVKPTGAKCWRYDYRFSKKRKTLALGVFPDVSIKEAREGRNDARRLLDQGLDPSHQKKIRKSLKALQADENFQAIATEWLEKKKVDCVESTYNGIEAILKNHVYDYIGCRPIVEITAPELLAMLNRLVYVGHNETAKRTRSLCSQVFRYAIVTGRAERDPASDLVGALPKVKVKSFATITDPKEIDALLRCIDEYSGDFKTRCALKLAPLVFVRPTELRHAEWSEINWDKLEWLIPAEKMKMSLDHIIPLSDQAVNILREIQLLTGKGKYVFPSVRTNTRPMSENTINASLRRMGYTKEEITGHGFRSMASTLLNEHGFNEDWVEMQLAHAPRNRIRAIYNRAKYLPQRKQMMQQWADYLDNLRTGADIIPFKKRA